MHDFFPRHVLPGKLYEITARTQDGRHWFSAELRDCLSFSIARAQKTCNIKIFAYAVLSNHYHMLVSAEGPQDMARFLQIAHASMARAVNRHWKRKGRVWARRASIVRVSDEPAAQLARLRYILANGSKEGLVRHPAQWGGPHVAHYFETGVAEGGPAERKKVNKSNQLRVCHTKVQRSHTICVSRLPHLSGLPIKQYLSDMRHLMDCVAERPLDRDHGIEQHLTDPRLPRTFAPVEARAPRVMLWKRDRGLKVKAIPSAQRPPVTSDGWGPFTALAHDAGVRDELIEQRKAFVYEYQDASARFRAGVRRRPMFPARCILPPSAWIRPDRRRTGLFVADTSSGCLG